MGSTPIAGTTLGRIWWLMPWGFESPIPHHFNCSYIRA